MSLEELRAKRAKLDAASDATLRNMQKLADESKRVADVAAHAEEILQNLDEEFERQTSLNSTDVKFLFFATALQVTRWFLLGLFNEWSEQKLDDKINNRLEHDDKSIKDLERKKRNDYKREHYDENNPEDKIKRSKKHRSFLEIVFDGVPYDVTKGSPKFNINMEGAKHRLHTLGHDPVLGWIVGTLNILSDTITLDKKYQFRTFDIAYKPNKHWQKETNIFSALSFAIDGVKEDRRRLPAAIFAQGLHLESDIYTKLGLPVPLLEAFDSELAGRLYDEGYDALCFAKDLKNVAVVGAQAIFAILINMIISLVHGLYYDPAKYASRDIYEVKTRKILMYSNLIASTSNLIYVGVRSYYGDERAAKSLDIGGIMVTIYRLINDTEFIQKVKEEFVFGGFYRMIEGKPLELEEVNFNELISLGLIKEEA